MPQSITSLAPSQPRLSKSKIAAFEHCPRRLWLQVHRRDLGQFDEQTLALFECGHAVGEMARRRYSQGNLVAETHLEIPAAIVRTSELLAEPDGLPIFEAAFERRGVIIRADILEPDHWGGWRLIEVKNSRGVKAYQIRDVATQAWVLQANRICISTIVVRHVGRPLRLNARNPTVRFVDADVTPAAQRLVPGRDLVVAAAGAVLQGAEPEIIPGPHCVRPNCEFRQHCFQDVEAAIGRE